MTTTRNQKRATGAVKPVKAKVSKKGPAPAVFWCGWDELHDLDLSDWAGDLAQAIRAGQADLDAKVYAGYVEVAGTQFEAQFVVAAKSKSAAADAVQVELEEMLERSTESEIPASAAIRRLLEVA